MTFNYKQQSAIGTLFILPKDVDASFGRDWLRKIRLDRKEIRKVEMEINYDDELKKLLDDYKDVMEETVGKIPNYEYNHTLQGANTKLIFIRPRPIPYALKPKVEELE
ncbi:hypothetical protein QE152_g38433 [Popillia japonica]|uniref:Uncharacterized protein n=1 Tax=Popillia japonica TaxID=7064 RepID=A0AAW1HWL1_POPJA